MSTSESVASSTQNVATATPLVFISHDSRDAELAEEFSALLKSVSAGFLKSFRSSDRKGTQGIEYGTKWYSEVLSKLRSASDVVCLLTERSLNRPWILYEAGIAEGKSDTPVLGIAIGIPLGCLGTSPFAQFQNSGDDEDSLTKLILQLARRIPNAELDHGTVVKQVQHFRERAAEILKGNRESEQNLPEALQRLRDNWSRHTQLYPHQPYPQLFKMYSFCGITDIETSDGASPEADLEDVYYLWTDAGAGSEVQAKVLREGDKRIRVTFDNQAGGHPSNVAFRIKGRNLLYKEDGFRTLKFSTRIPADVEEKDLKKVQLGIRVIDALNTHWIYCYLEGYRALFVDSNETAGWTEQTIDLSPNKWKVFETDGNSLYHDELPDFSMILAVVVEVGGRNAGRSGSGKGVVEFKDFTLE